ncbi:tektin-3 [Hyalella azteca]|uniref:Tektin n=1 Tax=Hyalella azteca TaxID=294128 RepID=A0A979FH05_HYAAZ|nr:tektin-3 [Hyalella azteca]
MAGLPLMLHPPAAALTTTIPTRTIHTTPIEHSLSLLPPPLARAYPSESRTLDAVRFPNIFSSATSTMKTRYTVADWTQNNMDNSSEAENSRGVANRIRDDAVRLVGYTYDRTNLAQRESSQRLGERVNDISFWRSEITQELERMMSETSRLEETRRALEIALKNTERPLHCTKEALYFRENRQGIDLVRDSPEECLLREVDTIKDCQARMKNLLERVNLQLSRNRAARHDLEHDTMNKNHSLSIDSAAHGLHNASPGITYFPGVERLDYTVTVPNTWAEISNRNVQQSQTERNSSQRLRAEVESLLASTHQDMWCAWSTSNSALTHRAGETNDTRNRLIQQRNKVQQEMNDLERHIDLLKKALLDKSQPLKVVHTRLEGRTHRPETELCRDPPQHRMVLEVQEISESVEALRQKLQEAEDSLHRLAQVRAKLDHDIAVKTNSLYVDRDKCLGLRRTFPLSQPHLIDFTLY